MIPVTVNEPPGEIFPGETVTLADVMFTVEVADADPESVTVKVDAVNAPEIVNWSPAVDTVALNDPSDPTVTVEGVVESTLLVVEFSISLSFIVTVFPASNPVPDTLKLCPV